MIPGEICCPSCDNEMTYERTPLADADVCCPQCDSTVKLKRNGKRLVSWGLNRCWDLLVCSNCGFRLELDLKWSSWGPVKVTCPRCGWTEIAEFVGNSLNIQRWKPKRWITAEGVVETLDFALNTLEALGHLGQALEGLSNL